MRKDKSRITISANATVFDKIQYPFTAETLNEGDLQGTHLNTIKDTYEKPTANITLNTEKVSLFSKIGSKTKMTTLATFIQHSTGSSSHSNQTRKSDKRHPNS